MQEMVNYSERMTSILALIFVLAGIAPLTGCMTTTVTSRSGFEVPTEAPKTRGVTRLIFAGDVQPVVRISPHYPDKEFKREREGRVVIEFTILATGQIGQLRLIESSGEDFAEAAGMAMRGVLFQPGYAGQTLRVEAQFLILRAGASG